jgi:hypothetical protein
MWEPEAPAGQAARARKTVDYVVETQNVHHLTTSLQAYAREKHYAMIADASIFCAFDKLLGSTALENLRRQQLFNLRLFNSELLRMFEAYDNVLVLPEVKAEMANLIAAGLAQIDRKKLQYNALSPAKKDQVVEGFNALLRIEELLRKIRSKIEERAKALPRTNEAIFGAILEMITTVADVLQLKKIDQTTRSDTDERIAARAFHEVIVHHKRIAVVTRDEDVRRIISSVYKLIVSGSVREESARIVTRALQLSNIVVLKWNHERDEYGRFFESSTQQEIGEFIFAKHVTDKARVKLIGLVRQKLVEVARRMESEGQAEPANRPGGALETPPAVLDAAAIVWDRMLWYQEVARAVGVADVHEEIRVQKAIKEVARALRHDALADAVEKNLQMLARKRLTAYLRELDERSEALNRELTELTQQQRVKKDIASADRLQEAATEVARIAREKNFFERALATGQVHLTHEQFRRTEELCERFAANGFDLREGERLVPANEIADLCGRDYPSVLRTVAEQNLGHESGLVRLGFDSLVRYFI